MKLQTRLAISFTLLALFASIIMMTGLYLYARQRIRDLTKQRLLSIVSLGVKQIDADLHATLTDPAQENGSDYKAIKTTLQQVRDIAPDLTYVYTMRSLAEPTPEAEVVFVVDAEADPEEISHLGDVYYEFTSEQKQMVRTLDHPLVEDAFYTDRWGTWLTAYAPIISSEGRLDAVLGIDMAVEDVLYYEKQFLWIALAIFLLLAPVTGMLGWLLGKRLTGPIAELIQGTERIRNGELSYRVRVHSKDEFAQLADNFNTMTDQLNNLINALEQGVADRTRSLEASLEVSRRLSTILDQDELVTAVVDEVQQSFNYYHAHIYLLDEAGDNLVMVGGTGEAGQQMLARGHKIPKGRGLVGRAAESGQAVLVIDTTADPTWLPNPLLPDTLSEVAVPIIAGGRVLGVLDVQQNTVGGLTQQDVDLLTSVANQVAVAVQNARLYTQTQRQAERETQVNLIGQKVLQTVSIEDALQVALRELSQVLEAQRGVIRVGGLKSNGN